MVRLARALRCIDKLRYTLLGTSLSFSLTFSVVDLVNQGSCKCCSKDGTDERLLKPIVQSSKQALPAPRRGVASRCGSLSADPSCPSQPRACGRALGTGQPHAGL